MAYSGSDSDKALTPQFFKLSGEPIPLKVPPSSKVCEVKHALAKILDVKGTLRLIDDTGKVLEANDMVAGDVQIQVMGIADGIWLKLFSAAFQGFDEEKLCKSITAAWPGDFNRTRPAPADHDEDVELMDWQKEVFKQLQPVITSSCGQWADYWTFGSSADSYGYNYVRPPYPTLQRTIELFVNDVKRWQKILLELEDEFAHLRSRCSGYPLCEHLEVAIAALLRHSPRQCTDVSWHVGFEMWYRPFSQLVSWYLSSVGLEDSDIDVLKSVSNAITGFRSYQCPRDTAVVVAQKVANQFHLDFNTVDSTADWLKIRSTLSALGSLSEAPTCPDTHLRFIEAVDAARSPERAQRMKHALAACRNAAKSGDPLSYDHLKNWQTHLMGVNAGHIRGYRFHDAYAKQGRERYPLYSESSEDEERFIKILEEANTTEPVALRATRAYLDVLFFHPFDDGCSRLARLVFDFVLTQANVAVNGVEAIFLFAKSARDAEGAQRLVELVEKQMAKPQFKELEDPPQIRTKFSEAEGDFKWFSCEAFPADR